jgi:hypothetical protein
MKNKILAFLALGLVACSSQDFTLPKQNNEFQQTPLFNNKVDIVFMADDSSSMGVFQRGLAGQMNSMVRTLNDMGMDYHIAVTTSSVGTGFSGGRFVGSPSYLTNANPNAAGLLTSRLLVGQAGSDLEQGLSAVKLALSPSNLSGANAGFLRDDALLAIIVLSNEDDYSAGSVQSYVDFFSGIKRPFANGARSWVFNFLGITALTSGCATQEGPFGAYIEPGLRYMDLVNASEGSKNSICTADWAQVVTNVKVRINQLLTDFYLSRKPKLDTIKVTINGLSVPAGSTNGWTYEEKVDNGVTYYFIRFHGSAVPSLYDKIEIKFDPFSAT